ncbi:CFEM domain-containing protein [Colletotrichum graminicola M1.001]|uniref:CFEM domain-containing protein n=1 Tax=Colletotrichum graminicola (strain M1.001 / M2 / FGSC 10212) TaxID=645133 RepID=E3QNH6_COLGM|nr:CFEM domain-containing protein [Colletotrichum graminicola M1.001]EFQ32463.1 CFEM domain-containing protein [Colletotrichum graminicola M1.001]
MDTPAPLDTPPLCGLKCIQQVTMATGLCPLTNTTCLCTDVQLNKQISLCVHSNCTVREVLQVQRYTKHECGAPSRDRTALVWIVGTVFLALGLLAFVLRVVSKIFLGSQTWGLEDWAILLAVAIMIPLNGLSYPISRVALGKDVWNVQPNDITQFLYIFYWQEVLYLGALPVTKISILLFYLKIFSKKEIRLGCWVLLGLNIAYLIVFELTCVFQCRPVEGAWKGWDGEFPAKCNNINAQGWAAAIANIALDLATLLLPLRELYSLSLSLKKKLMVMMMFCVGFFVTIVSIVRLDSLATYATTSNVTQDYVEVGYWSTIEVPVGIICASMPAIYSLFSVVFPKVFGSTQRGGLSDYANLSEPTDPTSGALKLPAIRVQKEFFLKSGRRGDVSYTDHELSQLPFRDPNSRSSQKKLATTLESV